VRRASRHGMYRTGLGYKRPHTDGANCLERPGRRNIGAVRIVRTFVWNDERPDDTDEIRSTGIDHHVRYQGVLFELRTWDIRYPPGQPRLTEVIYDEAVRENVRARSTIKPNAPRSVG
jgi:hypothetical protein